MAAVLVYLTLLSATTSCMLVHGLNSSPEPSQQFLYRAVLDGEDPHPNYVLHWSFDAENITFEVHVKTKGWFGFGLSPTGAMKNSDVVIGWIKDDKVHFADHHARGHETPPRDEFQDYELLLAKETEKFTIFKFRRKLDTCDPEDLRIEDGTSRIIYAWHKDDPKSDDPPFNYHGKHRGTRSLTLLDYTKVRGKRNIPTEIDEEEEEEEYEYFDTLMGNVSLSPGQTTYWCKFFRLPDFREKHHIVKISPQIHRHSLGLVHHIVVYTCDQEHTDIHNPDGIACYFGENPVSPNVQSCDSVIFAYAVGMEEFVLPEHVGYPIGRDGDPKYFYLEVHYDNPHRLSGLVDNSGLRFYYTSQLRQHDAGVLEFGHTVWWPPIIIPPRATDFKINNYCSRQCTEKYLPDGGIRLFGVLLHAHLAGHRMWIRHVRNGTELPEISRDDYYDFNYQQFRRLPEEVLVLPGDEILNTCTFNTRKRKSMTFGGMSTHDEMCFNFVMYYPRVEMTKCLSTVYDLDRLSNYIQKKLQHGDLQYTPKGPFQYLENVHWNRREIRRFHKAMFRADTYREYCEHRGNGAGPMVTKSFEERPLVRIVKKLNRTKVCRRCPRNVTCSGPFIYPSCYTLISLTLITYMILRCNMSPNVIS